MRSCKFKLSLSIIAGIWSVPLWITKNEFVIDKYPKSKHNASKLKEFWGTTKTGAYYKNKGHFIYNHNH